MKKKKTEITKPMLCILLRSGVEVWVDVEQGGRVKALLQSNEAPRFFELEQGSVVCVSDISGIFSPTEIENYKHLKNHEWVCDYGNWHNRGDMCGCGYSITTTSWKMDKPAFTPEQKERILKLKKDKKKVGKKI